MEPDGKPTAQSVGNGSEEWKVLGLGPSVDKSVLVVGGGTRTSSEQGTQPTNVHFGSCHKLGTDPEGELPSPIVDPPRGPQRDEVLKKTRQVGTDDTNSNKGLLGF